jgi:hypothetical protein
MQPASIAILSVMMKCPLMVTPFIPLNRTVIFTSNRHRSGRYHAGIISGPSDSKYREVLILVRPNELKEKWDGKDYAPKRGKIFQALEQ